MVNRVIKYAIPVSDLKLTFAREYVDFVDGKNVTKVVMDESPILAAVVYDVNDEYDYLIVDPMDVYPITLNDLRVQGTSIWTHRVISANERLTVDEVNTVIGEASKHFAELRRIRDRATEVKEK